MTHQSWRGQFARGTFGEGANRPAGQSSDCEEYPATNGCLPVQWPGWNTSAWSQEAAKPATVGYEEFWFGSLSVGMRDASGQQYMRNRYYNPQTGQFTQPDPIGLAGGLNSYGFAAGDPVSYSDPYGLSANCNPPWSFRGCAERLADRALESIETVRRVAADGARQVVSALPIIGDGNDIVTAVTGRDVVAGENVGMGGRILAGLGALSPIGIGSGRNFRAAAEAIGRGHAFAKHVLDRGEYTNLGIETVDQFTNLIGNVMSSARGADVRNLSNGRTAYWDSGTGTVVIHHPNARDQGTAFRPTNGKAYFDNLK